MRFVEAAPLDVLVRTSTELRLEDCCVEFLDCYDRFLRKIDDLQVRERLESLGEQEVYEDATFLECRTISHDLQGALRKVFFEKDTSLRAFTGEYGVF